MWEKGRGDSKGRFCGGNSPSGYCLIVCGEDKCKYCGCMANKYKLKEEKEMPKHICNNCPTTTPNARCMWKIINGKDYCQNCWKEVESQIAQSAKAKTNMKELKEAAMPLIKHLNNWKKFHPHHTVIVTSDSVELVEGVIRIPNIEVE